MKWFRDWEQANPRFVAHHLELGRRAFDALGDIKVNRVVEYFGGAGHESQMIQERFHPTVHFVFDNHPDSVTYLKTLPLPLIVDQEDFETASYHDLDPDLVVLDFGDFTWVKGQNEHRAPLGRVLARRTPNVVLTDVAATGRGFHLPARAYAKRLKRESLTYDEYLGEVLPTWFQEEFQYRVEQVIRPLPPARADSALLILRPA